MVFLISYSGVSVLTIGMKPDKLIGLTIGIILGLLQKYYTEKHLLFLNKSKDLILLLSYTIIFPLSVIGIILTNNKILYTILSYCIQSFFTYVFFYYLLFEAKKPMKLI